MNVEIKLVWPVDYSQVVYTQGFGDNPPDYARFGYPGHNGIDLAKIDRRQTVEIMAAATGKVSKVGYDANGYGNYVKLDHGEYQTLYGHMERVLVQAGMHVAAKDVIGIMGSTGNSTGPHLHFELRIPGHGTPGYPGEQVDPLPYFEAVTMSSPVISSAPQKSNLAVGDQVWLKSGYDYVNMRDAADIAGRDVGDFLPGMVGEILEIKGDWARVAVKVWIHSGYLEIAK